MNESYQQNEQTSQYRNVPFSNNVSKLWFSLPHFWNQLPRSLTHMRIPSPHPTRSLSTLVCCSGLSRRCFDLLTLPASSHLSSWQVNVCVCHHSLAHIFTHVCSRLGQMVGISQRSPFLSFGSLEPNIDQGHRWRCKGVEAGTWTMNRES